MKFSSQWLKEMKKVKNFLICIDSDGCAFDTMEVKHKECFIPNIINEWDLQAISKYAREVAEFVNLYSKWRGINRFPALINVMDLLAEREEVKRRGFEVPNLDPLRKWIVKETKLDNISLEDYVEKTKDPLLTKTLKWSTAVNDTISRIVRNVSPFPFVRESLDKMIEFADAIVVSTTPREALVREWEEHDISKYVKIIAGEEIGTMTKCIGYAKDERYEDEKVLMIGDTPGDLKAARANNVLFYPINPGNEDDSWERFYNEGLDKLIKGEYAGAYEEKLIAEFDKYLPSIPPWKKK